MQSYDVVILEDESLDIVNGIVKAILGHPTVES